MAFNEWASYSTRRRLLDSDLESIRYVFRGSVLEIGCGSLGRRGRFQVPEEGVDSWISVDLQNSLRPTVQGDSEYLPFKSEQFDCVVCLEVLEYVSSPEATLVELARVLKRGGVLVLACPFLHRADTPTDRWRFTEHGLRRMIDGTGMNLDQIKSQGAALSVVVNIMRFAVSRVSSRISRNLLSAALYVPLLALFALDETTSRRLPVLRTFSTGYLVVASKGLQEKQVD